MTEELRTKACEACGWPALANTRRCPYCREPFPKPPLIAKPQMITVAARRPVDALPWLALAWIAAMIPVCVLVLATIGVPFALPAFFLSFAPAAGVWLLHHRASRRIRRLSGRKGSVGTILNADDQATESGNTSRDARSR